MEISDTTHETDIQITPQYSQYYFKTIIDTHQKEKRHASYGKNDSNRSATLKI